MLLRLPVPKESCARWRGSIASIHLWIVLYQLWGAKLRYTITWSLFSSAFCPIWDHHGKPTSTTSAELCCLVCTPLLLVYESPLSSVWRPIHPAKSHWQPDCPFSLLLYVLLEMVASAWVIWFLLWQNSVLAFALTENEGTICSCTSGSKMYRISPAETHCSPATSG